MKKVAVILLNWNGEHLLSRFLPSVVEHTPANVATVYVADNGSTDGSLLLLTQQFPSVKQILFTENHGYAGGYNKAIAMVDEPYVVLMNTDVEVGSGWLEPLLAFMEATPHAGACQPKLHQVDNPSMFEYAGAAGGFIDRHGYPYCRGRVFATVEADHGQYDDTAQVMWASGACLMVRRSVYINAGGLDQTFFAHMEEIDLCWRMRIAGWSVWAVGASSVCHLGGGSLNAGNPRKTYLNFRNNLLMLRKNLPEQHRTLRLVIRRMLDTLAWARFLATLDLNNARAVIRAHRDYARMARTITPPAQQPTEMLHSQPNILTAYYLRGRKTFAEIHQ